jgi:hypothetical protein
VTVLADAGVELVPEHVEDLGTLTGQRDAEVLQVPSAVAVRGSVLGPTDGGALTLLPAQVVISARDAMVPLAVSVIETTAGTPRDGGTPHLQALFDPGRHYDVRAQPRFASSAELPPFTQGDVGIDRPLTIDYSKLTLASRSGRFIYRQEVRPDYVRLQERSTGRVLSSTARVRALETNTEARQEGEFTLFAQSGVFDGADFDLVISVADFDPWQVTITIDGARFLAGGDMVLPRVPKPVSVSNWVEDTSTKRLPRTDLTFVSNYPLPPNESDQDGGGPPTAFGADWCKWEDPSPIVCRGSFGTISDQNGHYAVDLIPGAYDVFISPRDSEPTSRNVIVTKQKGHDPNPVLPPLVVNEGSASGSVLLVAQRATAFTGTVYASNAASAKVTVRALRRPTPPFSSWGPVTDFNRSLSALSDRKGHFSIAPDVGYYDFIFEPEHDSYFAWSLWLDCPNGPGSGWPLSGIHLSAPVMVFGSVEAEEDSTKLAGAKIEAFTVVENTRHEARGVMIGRTFSNAAGDYALALPPEVGESRTNCEGRAQVTDSERARR